jgi:hypothetical protein
VRPSTLAEGYPETQRMAAMRDLAISAQRLAGRTDITEAT